MHGKVATHFHTHCMSMRMLLHDSAWQMLGSKRRRLRATSRAVLHGRGRSHCTALPALAAAALCACNPFPWEVVDWRRAGGAQLLRAAVVPIASAAPPHPTRQNMLLSQASGQMRRVRVADGVP